MASPSEPTAAHRHRWSKIVGGWRCNGCGKTEPDTEVRSGRSTVATPTAATECRYGCDNGLLWDPRVDGNVVPCPHLDEPEPASIYGRRMTGRASDAARSNHFAPQFAGVWIADRYVSLRGPKHRPLFTERNRIKCRVLPLLGGWRVVVRRSQVG